MENNNTVDSILEALGRMAEKKEPIDSHTWLEGVAKLTALIGNEQNFLFELEAVIAQNKVKFMEAGDNATKAKIKAEALDEYVAARKLKAKIDRTFELVRIGKLFARMSFDEYKSGQ